MLLSAEVLIKALIPYIPLLAIMIAALIAILIYQLLLAKYFSTSIFYWRNFPCLPQCIYAIGHNRLIKYPISLAILFSAMHLYPRDYWLICRKAVFLSQLKGVFGKLDDIVDNASAEMILAWGDASLGLELNPFLKKLLDQDDLVILNKFIEQNLISKKELYAFGNLFANNLASQAKLTFEYKLKQNAELQEAIAQNNIEISGAYLALMTHLIKKDSRVLASIEKNNGLSYSVLQRIYPKVTQGGELIQIIHDLIDFRYDLMQQPKIGKVSANVFLARLAQNTDSEKVFTLILNLPPRPVGVFELPSAVKSQLYLLANDFKSQSFKINTLYGLLYMIFWEYIKRIGFAHDKLKYQKKFNPDGTAAQRGRS